MTGPVAVYCCTDERRPDGFGLADNMPIRARTGDARGVGGHGPVMSVIAPQPEDVVFRREQGVTGFFATALDRYLRNTGVDTLIVTGISVNLAVLGTSIEAANRGYTVVVPTDAVAGYAPEYVETALRYTLRNIAFVVASAVILDCWARIS